MTKTYKIEKIPEVLGLNYVTLKNKLNEVIDFLEALSDKEEGEECTCDIYCHNGVHMNNCAYEPHHIKKEELKEELPCTDCQLIARNLHHPFIPIKCQKWCGKQSTGLKGILKSQIEDLLHENTRLILETGENEPLIRRSIKSDSANKILSFIQSHLVKEIEQRELEGAWIGENYGDVKQGFEYAKQDIIKIINNLLKIGYITQ